jgi:hypothetical protein
MKTNELKKALKPLIKQCIRECIFEEGVLSGLVTEVVRGLEIKPMIAESAAVSIERRDDKALKLKQEEYERERQERIRRLNESTKIKTNNVDIFEGTDPIIAEGNEHSPFAGTSPGDEGINIDGLVDMVGSKWKHFV